ncbi:MAG: NAD(P)-dependent oxidoreductase [Thermostichales cyanobacterium HHBFW_bins_127]
MTTVFVTGASGCVGHYVLSHLATLPNLHCYALVRDPHKLRHRWDPEKVTVVGGDLRQIEEQRDLLRRMDVLIHIATAWGGDDLAWAVNVTHTLELFGLLDPQRCQRIFYFSTASLLDTQERPIPVAAQAGTGYIRSKYEMLCRIKQGNVPLAEHITILYPTLLFGGDPGYPYSHITRGLGEIMPWLNLARFLRVDASFHFIHAADIAQILGYWLQQPAPPNQLILGNPPLTFDEAIEICCEYMGKRIWFRLPVPVRLLRRLSFLFPVSLSPWDDYCLQNRHFVYPSAVNAASFGLPSRCPDLKSLLATYLPARKDPH